VAAKLKNRPVDPGPKGQAT